MFNTRIQYIRRMLCVVLKLLRPTLFCFIFWFHCISTRSMFMISDRNDSFRSLLYIFQRLLRLITTIYSLYLNNLLKTRFENISRMNRLAWNNDSIKWRTFQRTVCFHCIENQWYKNTRIKHDNGCLFMKSDSNIL